MNRNRTRRFLATAALVAGLVGLPATAAVASPESPNFAEPGICKVFPWFC